MGKYPQGIGGTGMYDRHIDTFMRACELGSFTKAAAALYVTPSAVQQQVDLLEADLGVRLLDRSRRGVRPTAAGEWFYREARDLVLRSEEIRRGLARFNAASPGRLRVGTNYFHTPRALYELWFRYSAGHPDASVETVRLPDEPPARVEGVDVVEGLSFAEPWQRDFTFIELGASPMQIAFPQGHGLAGRRIVRMSDLAETPIIAVHRGVDAHMDEAAGLLESAGVRVIPVEMYEPSVFMLCAAQGMGALMPEYWDDLDPHFSCVPVDWHVACPFGLWVSREPSDAARGFLEMVGEQGRS